jgi:hypothetical protein
MKATAVTVQAMTKVFRAAKRAGALRGRESGAEREFMKAHQPCFARILAQVERMLRQ